MIDSDPVIIFGSLIWLTLFGMCIGSFLNVVIYRLPRGKSLSDPPSHCPRCNHLIRWYDNVPVFGWLMLCGKCRDCKEPISIRYPVIEALCGCIFGIISLLIIYRNEDISIIQMIYFVLTFSGLVVTFLAAGFIEQEGKPVPWRLFIPVAVPAPIMPYFIQHFLHNPLFVDIIIYSKKGDEFIVLGTLIFCIILCFLLAVLFSEKSFNNPNIISRMISGTLIGLYLGFLGVLVLLLSALLFFLVRKTWLSSMGTDQKVLSFTIFLGIILMLILFR
ncbi:MAG: prepilin peptidase [Planctomycetaceae bacterium]|jgi:prepilin signal peptidase PulO-like enzyme (type II secretory pathway)|nr:prepilin peptidase [Planctomycetaceae bacterium]